MIWLLTCNRQPFEALCLLHMRMQWPRCLPACSSRQQFLQEWALVLLSLAVWNLEAIVLADFVSGGGVVRVTPLKGPKKAVLGCKIAQNRFKTTYRSVLTLEEKKQYITHLFKTFSGLRMGIFCMTMHLFWQKSRKIQSSERFKTSAILNARFRESYFKLKVNGRAMTSQTGQQPNMEVGSVWVSTGQPTWKNVQLESSGMKLVFNSWAFV